MIEGILETWMFDTMVSMTLLMALVLLIRKPVARFFGPHIAYLLWAVPLTRLFMPSLTVEVPATPMTDAAITPAAIASDLAASAPVQQVAVSAFASLDWMLIGLLVWIGGAGMLFISKLASYFQFREDIISDGQLVGRHGNIKILETAAVGGPLAFGLFDKYIAVPTDFFRNYAPRERELALEHEITHHESGDLAANFVGLLILSLHWFNPVAWFAWIAFRQDQETACDARILQKSGRDVRAVYGRTIAKSASGHRLGLASPMNQSDKIKGRLKMLCQSEKSSLRKRFGALLVGAGTMAALPLTATVVYAEADAGETAAHDSADSNDEHVEKTVKITVDDDGKKKKTVKIRKRKSSSGDLSSLDIEQDDAAGETVNIMMLNGEKDWAKVRANGEERVYRIKRDGRTIILTTNKKLTDEQVEKMVGEAEESRLEADRDLKEHQKEMREHKREMRIEMREVEREIEEARREARGGMREAKRAMKEAEREIESAVREAERETTRSERDARKTVRNDQRQTTRIWAISNQIPEIAFAPRAPVAPKPPKISFKTNINCKAIGKDIAFNGARGVTIERAWAAVVDCSGYEPKKANRKQLLKMTLRALQDGRSAASSCKDKGAKHRKKMEAFDREIKHLERKITTA